MKLSDMYNNQGNECLLMGEQVEVDCAIQYGVETIESNDAGNEGKEE